jgi:cysteine/O-acetylserine efflux protein
MLYQFIVLSCRVWNKEKVPAGGNLDTEELHMFNVVAFLSYVFVMTFTPGPNNIMSMTLANRDGFKKTQMFFLGVAAGFLLLQLLCSYFNLFLYSYLPKVRLVMDIIGAAYMVFLAVKIVFMKPHDGGGKDSKLNDFLPGLFLQLINPKGILYCITVSAIFIMPYYKTHLSIVLFALFTTAVVWISNLVWGAFGVLFQKVLSKYQKPFNIVMGLLLVYCAVSLFLPF